MATYVERLKQASPEGYKQLSNLMSYTANERYGGVPQDWQAQILTPLNISDVPKQIDVSTASKQGYETKWDVDEYNQYSPNSYVKKVKDANGLAITAKYAPDGSLIGFEAPQGMRNWLSGNTSVSGAWDASGKPEPKTYTSRGGGFIGDIASDPLLGTIANVGAAYFGGPLGSAAWQLAQGNDLDDAAKAAAITYASQQAFGGADAGSDPNAVGGVYGPDNIDVGGGYNPSGATSGALTTELTGDNIDAGGGWSPATGATEAELASARAALTATPTEVAAAKAAGMTVSDYLNYARAGLLVNALTGDPLGLSGDGGQQSPTGQTGFAQVPIPAEWKSPTYAASSAPIDLSTIFSNQNMLGGTQWQGLPSQQNMSFNDIFAAGQQQTPMGTPVDINQIVSSILGQAATS